MNKLKFTGTLISLLLSGNMNLFAQDSVTVLSQDFNNGATGQEWSVTDKNGDGITWMTSSELNGIYYNGISSATTSEDWVFTPPFDIEAGKHYLVSYTIAQRGSFDEDYIELYYGENSSPESMTTCMIRETYNIHSGMVTRFCHISASSSGSHVIGIKLVSPAGNGIVSLKNIKITTTGEQRPQPVPAMTASSDNATKTVTLKWFNSKRDTDGAAISGNMNALVYQDDSLIATIGGMIAGEKSEYSFQPDNFSGKHTYSIALESDSVSDKTSKSIDLDDAQGELVPLYTFPLTKNDFNNSWKVENIDGSNTWIYDAGSAYMSAFGKSVNDWLITPGYELETGKRYCLTYKLRSSLTYSASLDVTMGKSQSSSAQNTVITSHNDLFQNGFALFTSPQFDVSEAGTYYFAFHATYVGNSIDVGTVTINYIESGSGSSGNDEELTYEETLETVYPDNINGDTSYTTDYHKRLSMEGVELKAVFTQAQIDEYTLAPNGIYAIEQNKEGIFDVDLENPVLKADFAGGCTYHNGKLYCNEYNSQGNIQQEVPVWKVLDAKTFEVLSVDTLNTNCENTTISLAYDETSDKIYGFVKDYVDTWLVEINPENGSMTRISDKMDYWKRYLSIGCDKHGNLFCIYMTEDNITGDQKHYLSRINKLNGKISDIGEITAINMLPEDLLINMKYRQPLFFDNNKNKMYWMMCSSSLAIGSQYAPLFEINTTNCNATLLTWMEDIYAISGAYFEEPMMNAPGIISDFSFIPDETGATTGTISFKISSHSYNGLPLSSNISYTVKEENGINLDGNAMPGETVTHHVSSTQGVHNLNIQLSNEVGNGPTIQRSFLIGYDMPAAPENIYLTDTLLTTTLRWNAPKTGIYGEIYDKGKLTYDIVRFPDEITVAQGIKDTVFIETHGEELHRCFYVVYSCTDNKRIQGVVSNDVVVGNPINPPYGNIFTTDDELYNYYTILDINNDRYTWTHEPETGAVFYPYNYQKAADDWLISPPLNLNANSSYTLTFSTFSSSSYYPESLLVTYGKGKTPELQSNILLDLPEVPAQENDGTITTYQLPLDIIDEGIYYYGFKAYSKEYQDYLFLYDIKISDISSVNNISTDKSNFTAYSVNGKINIINPEKDMINVYNTNGICLEKNDSDIFSLEVNPGVYIIKSTSKALKILVR